jgi:hypothetical protein
MTNFFFLGPLMITARKCLFMTSSIFSNTLKLALHPVSMALVRSLLGSHSEEATHGFMRHPVLLCNGAKGFLVLKNTM